MPETTAAARLSALVDAMDQLLDDMGPTGVQVSLFAKAKARVAMQPFATACHDVKHYMPLWQAQRVLQEHDQ